MDESDPEEQKRRAAIRKRALDTVRDGISVSMHIEAFNYRRMIRHLNDTIGMLAYELPVAETKVSGPMKIEIIVPSDLAMTLKLTYGGF